MLNRKIINRIFLHRFLPYFFIVGAVSIGYLLIGNPVSVYAQPYGAAIATTHIILNGNPQPGDIVSFDKITKTFHLARIPGDKDAFGVVVKNPILLLSDNSPGFPIVTSGEVSVNVTTENGPIKAGNYISPSSVPGKGVRATVSDPYIIGTAISSFPGISSSTQTQANTKKIYKGSIQMLFYRRVNPLVAVVQQTPQSVEIGKNIIFHIVKYILASLVAVGTVYVAFRASGSSMRSGIISIGRNPLAKSSIHSMLILNTIMIILISAVGLVAALALVFLPV